MKHKPETYSAIMLTLFLNIGFIQCSDGDPVSPYGEPDKIPLVKITDQSPSSIQLDPFDLKNMTIFENIISLDITHGGGCKEHRYSLFMSPAAFLESFPVQANLYLQHDSNGDACEALIDTSLTFDLRPIAELYRTFYGGTDQISINMFDYFEEEPDDRISTFYLPSDGKQFWLKFGEKKVLKPENIKIEFHQLLDESRCPADVVCAWEGKADIQLLLIKENSDSVFVTVTIHQYVDPYPEAFGYRIKLLKLDPYPRTDMISNPSNYRALLDFLKLD